MHLENKPLAAEELSTTFSVLTQPSVVANEGNEI